MNPASKASEIAKRARSRQDATTRQQAIPLPAASVDAPTGAMRRSQWYVWKACGEFVDAIFHPACTAQEARDRFYPDAKAIVHGD